MSVTTVPESYVEVQVSPQLIPVGVLTTLPPADVLTVRVSFGVTVEAVKLAEALCAVAIVNWQVVAVPEQEPLQPENAYPVDGVAVSVTAAPGSYVEEQVFPQLIPVGVLTTLPPAEVLTVNPTVGGVLLPPPPPQALSATINAMDAIIESTRTITEFEFTVFI